MWWRSAGAMYEYIRKGKSYITQDFNVIRINNNKSNSSKQEDIREMRD